MNHLRIHAEDWDFIEALSVENVKPVLRALFDYATSGTDKGMPKKEPDFGGLSGVDKIAAMGWLRGVKACVKSETDRRNGRGKKAEETRNASGEESGEEADEERTETGLKRKRKRKYNITPKSPKGDWEEKLENLCKTIEASEAFSHARVNARTLRRAVEGAVLAGQGTGQAQRIGQAQLTGQAQPGHLHCEGEDGKRTTERDTARVCEAILAGLAKWTEAWKADGWRYVPGRLSDWIRDGKYLEEPRKKEAPRERMSDAEEVGCSEIV